MALMFPRLARNFARNGYFPTDEISLERILAGLVPDDTGGPLRILDPCAGEGVAVTEIACHLGERAQACAVEFDAERAAHCATMADQTLHCDLMDTIISQQAFSLLFLNPPYGDHVKDDQPESDRQGRNRLEKLFYQRTLDTLMYGGILVLILPYYTLDKTFAGWLANSFADVQVYSAATDQFKQVVITGRRIRRYQRDPTESRQIRDCLVAIGKGDETALQLPTIWASPYCVPAVRKPLTHFYCVRPEPQQLETEIASIRGLWPGFSTLGVQPQLPRPPARKLSRWHLALALAAGAITGIITSPAGRTLVVRGDTWKIKARRVECTEDDEGNITETVILTDRFVPAISAWDMTPDSATFGSLITIR